MAPTVCARLPNPFYALARKCSTHFSKGALFCRPLYQSAKGPMTDKDGERSPDLADLLAAVGFSESSGVVLRPPTQGLGARLSGGPKPQEGRMGKEAPPRQRRKKKG
jgi:hypothetical protein